MWLKITSNYSPNFSIPRRQKKNIKYIIIHYTGMKNELSALNRLTDYKSKVSACLLYTSPSPRDLSTSRMPSSA